MIKPAMESISLKIWAGVLCILLGVMMWLVITASNMAPEVAVLPQVFARDTMNFHQFMEATPLSMQAIKEQKLLDEMFARYYVENRNEYIPSPSELSYRWGIGGPVWRLSAPHVYNQFMAGKEGFAENAKSQTRTTMVDIINVARQDDTFTIDFNVYQFDNFAIYPLGMRRAVLKKGRGPRSFGADFVNPFGFRVVDYNESSVKK